MSLVEKVFPLGGLIRIEIFYYDEPATRTVSGWTIVISTTYRALELVGEGLDLVQ
jgi:hypothetical protein